MAGKYHRDYNSYARTGGGHVLAPGSKMIAAYAEGYNAYRSGAAKANPHSVSEDDNSDFQAWEYGWQDGERGEPPTHVGGPQAEAPEPPPDTLAGLRTHEQLNTAAAEADVILPSDWDSLTVAAKKEALRNASQDAAGSPV